ncbi:MAG: hypothetical protein K2W96_15865, partial [Gemmataceae bacterium]|nr:hypothetical protein [Gemmataceae bacterium]
PSLGEAATALPAGPLLPSTLARAPELAPLTPRGRIGLPPAAREEQPEATSSAPDYTARPPLPPLQ